MLSFRLEGWRLIVFLLIRNPIFNFSKMSEN